MFFINHDKLRMICSVDMSSKKEIYMEMSKKFRTNKDIIFDDDIYTLWVTF
ncbi:hypothetical protein BACPEC_00038 [[Bacteroides] pectinophilus ATCC 43243]|uniref:Uncharacterized protein n=1 Tax=[Bacteroides] pectinophilus ATCC 43243 TaxID=483218 RepID=B7AMY6_9FIRM|nr:hypothetical protein BACPEC_00038 [[Bacteroides] pectinophilus ATCC 43243]